MTTDVITVAPMATRGEVLSVLRDARVRHVPVVANEVLLGIISDRDLRRVLGESTARDAAAGPAGEGDSGPEHAMDIMTRHVRTTAPYCPLGDVVELILEKRIHALPVVADEKLLGIVTETDIVRAILNRHIL